jgi:hypothetical protein
LIAVAGVAMKWLWKRKNQQLNELRGRAFHILHPLATQQPVMSCKSIALHSVEILIPFVSAHTVFTEYCVDLFVTSRFMKSAEAGEWKSVLSLYFTENPLLINVLNVTGARKVEYCTCS